ncbi:MAG: bifunctional diaminohydroxyphosphoribosylaminopyrimidine deaminase/5-amino-6-(5-phosphoribosylamino)uracil reductase RibD [Acidothermaceae bacterium]
MAPDAAPGVAPDLAEFGTEHEVAAMRRAIALAERGLGSTSPNPIVGCVILDAEGRPVGEGFHERAGGPHAEIVALRAAADRARGGTAVVTLEPCAHTGRTGPCTKALIHAGIRRVAYAVDDPSALGRGGADALRASRIEVVGGLLEGAAARSNEAWLHRARTGRPFVVWKYAATLDGRVAAADGTSRWITGEAARHDVHVLRSRADAVVVGTGTALADDPALTVRLDNVSISRQPLRVVVGRRQLPPSAKVLDDSAPTAMMTERNPETVLKMLAERDVVSVLIEGGPTLAGAFMAAGLIDKVVAYIAPAFLGSGKCSLGDAGIATIGDALRWHIDAVDLVGADIRVVASRAAAGE